MLVIYFCGQFDLPELFVSVGLDLLLALDDEAERRELARTVTDHFRLNIFVAAVYSKRLESREGRPGPQIQLATCRDGVGLPLVRSL